MSMPKQIVFLRHGQSEANVVQKKGDHGVDADTARRIMARPDWQQRLSPLGRTQASQAGNWIRKNIGSISETFDAVYCSPYLRTRETAALACGKEPVEIIHEDRLIERDWGLYGKHTRQQQSSRYPETFREKKENPLFARLDNGESLMDVNARVRDMQGTLHREYPDGKVLMVTHGDLMSAWLYEIAYMLPEEFEAHDREFRFTNCTIMDFTRVNPHDSEDERTRITWMRIVHTTDPDASPNGGKWVELTKHRRYTPAELLQQVEIAGTLLPDGLYE
ncbi:histidine phosphatase family protein [Candidatus Saccharibacteria bacterium]|nr:histidine phosphatase family protein [Candidatus Saccharibacteria bacterium]